MILQDFPTLPTSGEFPLRIKNTVGFSYFVKSRRISFNNLSSVEQSFTAEGYPSNESEGSYESKLSKNANPQG